MQRQSYCQEQAPIDDIIVTNRFLSLDSSNSQDASLTKPSLNPTRSLKPSRLSTHAEIIRRDAISPIPLKKCDDILEIRSTRQSSKPAYNNNDQPSIITINVSGDRFQTHLSTLQFYPNTLLGHEKKRKLFWNAQSGEYFFDRHRACFEAILYYYQSQGCLRRPDFVPLDTFLEEIAFFELGPEALNQVREVENVKPIKHKRLPRSIWRRYIWFYFECPQHSNISRAISLISIFFTILSCVSLAIESLPQYTNHWEDICKLQANISLDSTYVPRCSALFTSPFFIIQTICVIYFTIEFLLRVISTPSYPRFIFSFFNWVDLSAIIPYYVFLGIELANKDIGLNTNAILSIRVLRILRFARIFKIYLVFQRLKSLRVLSAAMKESLLDFSILITILTSLAFLFGAATYLAEQEANGDVFDSIPKSVYWGIITMTGVGYGDMCPITATGRVLTCICALFGTATMGILTSVLVDRYQRVYNRKMYVSEPDISTADLDIKSNLDDEARSICSGKNSGIRRQFSGISQQLSSLQGKIKHDRHQTCKLEFVVSFKDDCATDHIVTIMKRKFAEVISMTDIDVNLRLMDDNKKELWTVSSCGPETMYTPKFGLSMDDDDDDKEQNQQSTIENF